MVRKFSHKELERFFRAIDLELNGPCTIVVIGGAALELRYATRHATTDVDLWQNPGACFLKAVVRATKLSVIRIPISPTPIAEPPYNFEDRLHVVDIKGLERLKVQVPEPHDLALLKVARGEAHDLEAISEMNEEMALSLETLMERYKETRSQVTGPKGRFLLNFLALVARLYGDDKASEVEKELEG